MFQSVHKVALTAAFITLAAGAPSHAQTASGERGLETARNLLNITGFTAQCMETNLLDQKDAHLLAFGGFLGGYLLASILEDSSAIEPTATSYIQEGLTGRVHDFDDKGKFAPYNIEFSGANCATVAQPLKGMFNQFSQAVLAN